MFGGALDFVSGMVDWRLRHELPRCW